MISDVLFEAVSDIEQYQKAMPFCYDEMKAEIEGCKAVMKKLQRMLDMPPTLQEMVVAKSRKDESAPKSVAAARRLGFRPTLPEHYGGEQVTVKGKTLVRNPFVARSETAWSKTGCTIIKNAKPHATVRRSVQGQYGAVTFDVYRHDQVERKVVNTITGKVVLVDQREPVVDPRRIKELQQEG